jgi:hypothetical protein
VPAIAWLVWRRPAVLRFTWIGVPAAVVGAAPWLAWNLRHGWNAVVPESVVGADSTYLGRFWDFFALALPTWLGLRLPYSLDWTFGSAVGVAVLVLALAGFAYLLARRPPGLEPLLVLGVAFPFLYAASSFTYFTREPRYLVFLAPVPALVLGRTLTRPRLEAAGLAIALAVSVVCLRAIERQGLFGPRAHEGDLAVSLSPLISLFERERVDRVLANYWIAYRISFESDERVIATSTGHVRYQPHDRLVRASSEAAYVFLAGSADEERLAPGLETRGFRKVRQGKFDVYLPPPRGS